AGAPLPTMLIGTLPVVIAVVSNLRQRGAATATHAGRLRWRRLVPSLALIGAGIALVHHAELLRLHADPAADLERYGLGALLALGAVACWTWYPIRNAEWLRAHAGRSPRTWATAQGVATLPLAALGFGAFWLWQVAGAPGGSSFAMPFGPTSGRFVGLMLAMGLLASWLGTLCWNEASRRLPTTLAGQLIVFETLAALAYALALRGQAPPAATLAGAALLVAGVAWALRAPQAPAPAMPA
ncbi:MAG: EamA/RhaT family transporter, partial [Comamonadaceae bacterium]|nr:EamA/RhaT family transporter [Comamonadaceae bacterium]